MQRISIILILLVATALCASDQQRKPIYVSIVDCVLPQVADGNGWSTRITLVNMDDVPAEFTLSFYRSDGQPWTIALKGFGSASQWQGTIPVGGSLFLETTDPPVPTVSGWAYLDTWDRIGGMAVFRSGWLTTHDMEAVVPFANEFDDQFYIPFDNRNNYVTSLAFVNPYDSRSVSVTLEFRDAAGNRLLLDKITLPPLNHMAFETTNRYPQTIGKNGVIEFTVAEWGAPALGLLFNPRGSFTSVHALSR